MARAKEKVEKKKQGGQPTGQPNNRTGTNPVQPDTKPSGRPTRQSTQQATGQVDPSKTAPDAQQATGQVDSSKSNPVATPPSGDPGPGTSSPTDRTPLDPTAPPYVPRPTQKSSPTLSSSSRPRVIEVETVSSNSVHSAQMSPHRFDDAGGTPRQDPPSATVNPTLGSHPCAPFQSPPDAQFSPVLSTRSAINHRSPSDPDPFSPVSIPPTLLPTPEPIYVPSEPPPTNRMLDNGYWRAVAETPPQTE
jgi:hypothetical protein